MRKLLVFGAVLLALSLSCAEIPELLTICDNTSNDFVLNPSSSHPSALQSPLKSVPSIVAADSNSKLCFHRLHLAFSLPVLLLAGQDLLTLHSVQRK
jgi:hypothetical protein